ncbi:FAD:protein FMN transferase [Peptoniphilus sp. MSJ-1]|uniref:FAD:protein FMN transferase n=1 Tax=Peptoniphilus ovalis TaxID=2841503 RepID=A0ABS6FHT0_9FIRM|nr:FAD:protein FMN transferase [Peptoniphilus ovalis]MBU5669730.1 FAD:protein FMN transferase [Peptoniphilus ovalis]
MKKKFLVSIALSAMLLFTACDRKDNTKNNSTNKIKVESTATKGEVKKYNIEFYDTFDTVIDIAIYSDDENFANENLKYAKKRFQELHMLFDNYKNYDGIINAKSINDDAGTKPLIVDLTLYNLIKFSVDNHNNISHKTNIAMGPVTGLWNSYRTEYEGGKTKEQVVEKFGQAIPTEAELETLRPYTNISNIKLNDDKKTVEINKGMSLDLGATAKGYATEIVARELEERGVKSALISAGGNVRAIGSPGDGREFYKVGIQNPTMDPNNPTSVILNLKDMSAVTSGDYQRYFEVDGVRYCHIIDPDTLQPSGNLKSVTVIAKDSGLCDFLSTACFNSTEEEIKEIAAKTNTAIIWITEDNELKYTENALEYIDQGEN